MQEPLVLLAQAIDPRGDDGLHRSGNVVSLEELSQAKRALRADQGA
jgi:hypothetical protein